MKDGRIEKINAELQTEIANIIRNEIKDPRVDGIISVLRVDTDNDLYMANVYISIYNSHNESETYKALQKSSGFVRKLLAKRVKLRAMPIVNFKLDKTMDYSEEINSILEKLDIPEDEE